MGSIILLVMGVIFIAAGLFAGGVISSATSVVPGEFQEMMGGFQNIFTYIFVGVGGLMAFFGLIGLLRGRRSSQNTKRVLAEGVDSTGRITFVDRNYSVQVNNRPIYSIVEYTYTDGLGTEYVNRITNANTEQVIRSGWQVGSTISIRYLQDDPSQSAIVM